jgi:hypothetical protein
MLTSSIRLQGRCVDSGSNSKRRETTAVALQFSFTICTLPNDISLKAMKEAAKKKLRSKCATEKLNKILS